MVDTLPDEEHNDLHWTIRQLVKRRNSLVKGIVIAKNQLNSNLTNVYPSYKKYFCDVDNKTALLFWEKYPHPKHLKGVTPEVLLEELRVIHKGMKQVQAEKILMLSEQNSPKEKEFQTERDLIIKSLVKEIRFKKQENEEIDSELERLVELTGYKLHTMPGINLITASNIISEIGNVERFPNSDKLAQFCGISPVNFSSAGKGKDHRSRQGNRVLNAIFHFLSIQLVQVSPSGKPRHPVFREYFEKKVKEGKTKPQALVCVSRRAVRIIYGMMRTKTEYKPFEKVQDLQE
jgi:transposase